MCTGVIERLHEAISALADVDLDALTDAELDDAAVSLQRERHRLAAAAARALTRWDGRRVWTSDGSRSAAARLGRDSGAATSTAKVELRRARAMAAMPATAGAVAAGVLSMDHVDLFARADSTARHELFARDETMLVEQCTQLRFAQAVKVVEYWMQLVDAAGCEDAAARQEDSAHLHASTTFDGMVRIDGVLEPVGGAVFSTELARLERELYLADEAAGVVRTAGQRRAAALVEMARRSAGNPDDTASQRPLFTVVLGDDSFARLCELAAGTVITPGQLLPYLGPADLEVILFGDPFTAVAASNRRTFTGRLRRAIEVRDRHCQHPSRCDAPAADCDVDHIVPHSDGGPTDQFNGRLECRPHNRNPVKHDHGATPRPPREVTLLDELRALIRWRNKHIFGDDVDTDGDIDIDEEPAA